MHTAKKVFSTRLLSTILAVAMLLSFLPTIAFAQETSIEDKQLQVAVISDLHVVPPSMWGDNPDSEAAIASDRKMFAESAAIFDAAIAGIIEQSPDVVLVPGDLTKDGEYDAHIYVAEKLAEIKEALPDVNIYVINGNHDINNPHAYDYSSGRAVAVDSVTPEEFREIYSGLGYGDNTSEYFVPSAGQAGSNSYVTRPADGFTVIAIDAAKYSADATRSGLDRQETGGNLSAELLTWVLEKTLEAEELGDTVIAFMHHGLVPHFSLEPTLLADFLADNYIEASEAMADAGVRYVFTGHMHAQNIASMTSAKGNTLYDIETGSLVTYPSPIRYATFIKGVDSDGNATEKVDITSTFIKEIDFIDPATGEKITDLTQYGYDNSIDEDTIGGLVMGVVAGGFIDVSGLLGGLLDAEFITTGGETHTGSRALFESMLPSEDADGNPVSNDFGDFMIGMMREMLPKTQADGIDVQGLVKIFYEISNSRIRMAALGGIGNLYITDANMRAHVVNPTFTQLDALLSDEAYVNALLGRVIASLVDMTLYVDESDNPYTFFDLGKYVYLAHLAGDAVSQPWVDAIIAGLADGSITEKIGEYLSDRIMHELGGVFDDIKINTNSLITNDLLGALLKSTFVNAMGGNPAPLGGILDMFGIDFIALVGGDALGGILPADTVAGLGDMVGGLVSSFIAGSGNEISDNAATLYWVGVEEDEEPIIIPDPLTYFDFVMSPGSDESEINFTWYTEQSIGKLAIRAQGEKEFNVINAANAQRISHYFHKASAVGLRSSTVYEYRLIGANGDESDIFTVTTGNPETFSFFAVGDIQIGSSGNVNNDTNGWVNTMNRMTSQFPDASFIMSAGDQVETAGTVTQYTGLLRPEQLINYPFAPAVGNHDSGNALFKDHFNLPNTFSPSTGAAATDYWYRYGEVLFIVLDSNVSNMASHNSFIRNAVDENADAIWRVVMYHHAPYCNASHRNDSYISGMRNTWIPVFDELEIDVVLNGHDHSYVRTYQMLGNVAQKDQKWLDADGNAQSDPTGLLYNTVVNPTGTAYFTLNSGSGSKYYTLTTAASFVAKQNQANRPNFTVADVIADSFTLTTYQVNANGTLTEIDTYTIIKTEEDVSETYTVVFDFNDGVKDAVEVKVAEGKTVNEPEEPTREGFTFRGWFAEDADEAFDFGSPITRDITLTAMWDEISVVVKPTPIDGLDSFYYEYANNRQNANVSTTVSGHITNMDGKPIIAEVQLHWGKANVPYKLTVVTTYPTDENGYFFYEIPTLEDTDVYEMRIRVSKGGEYEFVEIPFEVKEGWNTTLDVSVARIIDDLTLSGWYAGDGHQHSTYSDGRNSVEDVARQNIASGNSWGMLTDHRNMNGQDEYFYWTRYYETDYAGNGGKFLPVRGFEWTSSNNGHMNVFGAPVDMNANHSEFPGLAGEARNAEHLRRLLEIQATGAFVQANHPTTIPFLNGVGIDNFIRYWFVDSIEVWNSGMPVVFPNAPYADKAVIGYEPIEGWFNLLNGGARTAATATTDSHTIDVLKNSADSMDVGMIGGMLSLLIDDEGNFLEDIFDALLPMIGELFGGFDGGLDLPGDLALIIPADILAILATGDMELIGPALKSLFKDVLIPALPTVMGWVQTGLNHGTTKTYAYLPDGITEKGLLDALRNGNTFLSNGPLVFAELNGQKPDNRYGYEVVLSTDGTATLSIDMVSNRNIDSIFIIADGEVIMTIPVDGKTYKNDITLDLSGKTWVLVDVWGDMYARAYTNPFYVTTTDTAADKAAKADLQDMILDTMVTNPTVMLAGYEEIGSYLENLNVAIDEATDVLFDKNATTAEVENAVKKLQAAINGEAEPFTAETLTLQPGNTARDMNFNWYSDRSSDNDASIVKIAKKADMNGNTFPVDAMIVEGTVGEASDDKRWHKVSVTGLEQDAVYVYCVSNDKNIYSEIYEFKTSSASSFKFAVTGDPQLTVGLQDNTSVRKDETTLKGWQDTMAAIAARGVDFIAGVGDQVDLTSNGSEAEYTNFFAPDALRSIPFAPAIGNHDRHYLFNYHWNIPNEMSFTPIINAGNATNVQYQEMEVAGNYWYTYNNALFVVLNDSGYPESKEVAAKYIAIYRETLAAATAANPNYTWLFVQHHKSTASVADHCADRDIQYYVEAGFEKLMDEFKVDFVLAGHDHVYARSYPMQGGVPDKTGVTAPINNPPFSGGDGAVSAVNPKGTVYFTTTTASGLKYYELFNNANNLYVKDNPDYPYLVDGKVGSVEYMNGYLPLSNAKYLQDKTPGYLYVEVDGDTVTFSYYNLDDYADTSYDTYKVTRTETVLPDEYTVTFVGGEGYEYFLFPNNSSSSFGEGQITVDKGGNVQFNIRYLPRYTENNYTNVNVYANGAKLTYNAGWYVVRNVQEDIVITVDPIEKATNKVIFRTPGTMTLAKDNNGFYYQLMHTLVEDSMPVTTLDGHTFAGWYLDSEFTQPVVYPYDVARNTTVWAKFEKEAVTLLSIAVTEMPNKTEYFVGDTLDLTGMVVTATYSDGSTKAVTNYTTSPGQGGKLNYAQEVTVQVRYQEDGIVVNYWNLKVNVKPVPVAVTLKSASTTAKDFISIVETSKNSKVWVLSFKVTETYSDGTTKVVPYAIEIKANNANIDGKYDLGKYTLIYDIKGNGSNIKEFRVVMN